MDEFDDPMSGYAMNGYSSGADEFGGTDFGSFSNIGNVLPTSWGANPATLIRGGVGNPGRLMRMGGGALIVAGTGARIGMRKVWALTKQFGPEMAAGALGYSVTDLISALFSSGVMTRRRRRRGISSRDIRTTRRVCRFAASLNQTLSHCGPRARRRSH